MNMKSNDINIGLKSEVSSLKLKEFFSILRLTTYGLRLVLFLGLMTYDLVLQPPMAAGRVVEKIIATVNGENILQSEFEKNFNLVVDQLKRTGRISGDSDKNLEEVRKRVLDQMIDDKILLQEAKRRKVKTNRRDLEEGIQQIKERFKLDESKRPLNPSEQENAFINELKKEGLTVTRFEDRIKDQLMVIKLIEQEVKAKIPPPGEEDAQKLFDKIKTLVDRKKKGKSEKEEPEELQTLARIFQDRFSEKVRARHILIKTDKNASSTEKSKARKKLENIKRKIESGEDFAEMSNQYSEDTESAKRGGDLGFFIRGWMVPEFEKVAFSLPVGQVSNIVETMFGYHLILVDSKQAAQKPRFEELKEELRQYLYQSNAQKKMADFIKDLRSKSTIEAKDN